MTKIQEEIADWRAVFNCSCSYGALNQGTTFNDSANQLLQIANAHKKTCTKPIISATVRSEEMNALVTLAQIIQYAKDTVH